MDPKYPPPHDPNYKGYTLEELDQFGDLDSLPYSLDSEVWQRKPAPIPAVKPKGSDGE